MPCNSIARMDREMKNRLVIVIAVGCLVAAMLAAGCTQTQASAKEIKIGVVASMTGPASTTGKDMWQSAVVAADEINAKGGVFVKENNGRSNITLILGDDESTREGGMKAVSKLINDDKVDLLVGGFSSAVTSAHQSIVADAKVPYIITGASSPIITHRTDINTSYMFHHCPTTDDYGQQTTLFVDQVIRPAINAKFGFSADRPIRLAVVYQDSPYGKGVLTAVEQTIASRGLNIQMVSNETFKMGETDFRTILSSVKAAKPDVVYPATFLNEQIPLVTQARRDVGLDTIFLAVECCDDPALYKDLGLYGEGSVIESRFSPYIIPTGPISDDVQAFRNAFQAKWNGFPGMMGASTYEGVYTAASAIETAGTTDKATVRNTLQAIKVPELIESMQGGFISFSKDFRESKFNLYMEQLYWNGTVSELRPHVVWPDSHKDAPFVLPDWYRPGSP
ncbi:MAG: ABC transporter substrate-binding protein [Methanoregulaceae archaeon]|nr:ABC transporter substrate-binding protein [Methanoregulaceae archaeon]